MTLKISTSTLFLGLVLLIASIGILPTYVHAAAQFSIGDVIAASGSGSTVHTYSSPSASASIVTSVVNDYRGTVVDGPVYADGHTWWQVEWQPGSNYTLPVGWVMENDLSLTIPIQVCTPQDLDNVRNKLYADYIQTCDIDLSGYANWVPIGPTPDKWYGPPFSGTYDGNGKRIANLKITGTGEGLDPRFHGSEAGLFSASIGIIKNVTLVNVDIRGSYNVGALVSFLYGHGKIIGSSASGKLYGHRSDDWYHGNYQHGGLVGVMGWQVTDNPSIEDSSASVEITTDSDAVRVGGLVGGLNSGSILNSFATGDVLLDPDLNPYVGLGSGEKGFGGLVGTIYYWGSVITIRSSYATGDVSAGFQFAGGLIGTVNSSPLIENSYATGNVTSSHDGAGGLIGKWQCSTSGACTLSNSYATGNVTTGSLYVGGLIGVTPGIKPGVTLSYWDTETSGQTSSAGGEGKTTAEMQTASTYQGWDFADVWTSPSAGIYPILKGTSPPPPPPTTPTVSLDANGQSSLEIYAGDNYALNWNSTNSAGCTVAYSRTDGYEPKEGYFYVTPNTAGSGTSGLIGLYVITCIGTNNQSVTASVQITAIATPPTISADPSTVPSGSRTTIKWNAPANSSCTYSSPTNSPSDYPYGSAPPVNGQTGVGPLTENATYTITCNGQSASADVTVTAPPPPPPPPPSTCTFNGKTVESGASVTAYQSPSVPNGSQCVSEQRTCSSGTLSGSYTNVSCTAQTPLTISASPTPCTIESGKDVCTSTISWTAPEGVVTQVWVDTPSSAPELFSCQMLPQSLSKEAPWITTAGDTFYLYQTNSCDPSAISGLTSKASVTVKGTGGATSTPPPTATPTASLVTATLTANGGSDITINAGEYVTLNWSSTNAASVSGVVTSDSPDTCTTKLSFTGTKGSGSYKLGPIGACRAGHTYTITYTAVDASGNRASASAIVHVRATSASAPLSSFTAAVLVGMQSTLTQISEMLRGLGGN